MLLVMNASLAFSQTKLKGTIAVESFKLAPVSTTTQKFVQTYYPNDVKLLGDSFAALFTDKLRKAGFNVVTRKNIDSLLQENQLSQAGIVDDEGSTKLKVADYRLIGTIRQFEENEKSNTAIGVVGAIAGVKVKQAQAKVEVVVELISRDGTVIASASGVGEKTGKISTTSAAGSIVERKIFGIYSNSTTGFESTAMTNATSSSADNAVKEISKQIKNISEELSTKTTVQSSSNYNLDGLKTVILFPDSLVAEEVFSNAVSSSGAKIVQSSLPFNKNIFSSQDTFAEYSRSLAKSNGNPKILIVGLVNSENVSALGQNATRINMTVKVVRLSPFEFIHQESAQNTVADLSNKIGYDRAVKQASLSLVDKVLLKISSISKPKNDDPITYSLNLTGFQSFSSAKRFVDLLKKNSSISSVEIVDYSGQNLVLDVKSANLDSVLEQDKSISEFFTININSVNDGKIIGTVIIR